MAGFKRAQALDILGISLESLHYWRKHLDPSPMRKEFSVNVLLGYHILKILIKTRGIGVKHLAEFDNVALFSCFEDELNIESENRILVLNNESHTFALKPPEFRPHINDYELETLPLGRAVSELRARLLSFGRTKYSVS